MLEIISFTREHIPQARILALSCYNEEREAVPALPEAKDIPSLDIFSDNGLGMAAVDNGRLIGFLCCYNPWDNVFGTSKGTFSPVHAHGAVREERAKLYSLLYKAAAEKWVREGILNHCIALYAHDKQGVDSLFRNGFGVRCVDAVRYISTICSVKHTGLTCRELCKNELNIILPMKNGLIEHLRSSPVFIPLRQMSLAELEEENKRRDSRFFIAVKDGSTAAFIEIMSTGENFACEASDMANICGAYAYPEHRGTGVYAGLLEHLLSVLQNEGYARLGVDYESINPTARGFWEKYFTPYTYSVTRRIDERVYKN